MKTLRSVCLTLIWLGCLPWSGRAADYARVPLLTAPLSVRDDTASEVVLARPVSRRHEMAQLDVVFSSGAAAKYTFQRGGLSSARGMTDLAVTFVTEDGKRYVTDVVIGRFYANGVLPKFKTLPPRNVPLRKMLVSGMNVPEIQQIYWIDGREKRSDADAGENLSLCGEGECRWREAVDYCSSRGGRLLTVAELKGMYAAECAGRDLDVCRARYWASAEYATYPRKAWYVDFSDGQAEGALKTTIAYVRCRVKAGAAPKSGK